jgi:uncharacterized protein with PIN domain
MAEREAELRFAADLIFFLAPRHRGAGAVGGAGGRARVACDGTSTLGHLIESLGVPLPEVGSLTVDGHQAAPGDRLHGGEHAEVGPVRRPQPLTDPRFVLDVHLGTLARRLRLVGVDVAYANDMDDDELIEQANAEGRVLLTKDRALLCRRRLGQGAYVRGRTPDDQLRDVLERFAPPLAPWTRCLACNGPLTPVGKSDVEHLLKAGTRRTQDVFARCADCRQVYWRGAHGARLEAIVTQAMAVVGAAGINSGPARAGS